MEETKFRALNNIWKKLVFWVSISYSLFNIYSLIIVPVVPWIHLSINIAFTVFLTLIIYKNPLEDKYPLLSKVFDIVLIITGVSSALYYAIEYMEFFVRVYAFPTTLDIVFATLLILIVLEITRRANGTALALVGLIFLAYGFFGHLIPGPLGHAYFTPQRIVTYLYTDLGIYGTALAAVASFVFLFILFGAFLKNFGGGEIFIRLATGIAGSYRGGPAKVAVIGSALFGTIAGSSIANVAATGSFTIPLMKKIGYKPEFAGGVEAAASTGGQLMPPVMGSTAFVLAEIVGVAYAILALRALVPAILYFFAILIMVDCEAIKNNLKGLPKDQLPNVKKLLSEKWPFLMPIIVIFFALLIFKVSTTRAATFGIITAIFAPFLSKGINVNLSTFIRSLSDGAMNVLGIVTSCLTAGIVIGILALTGLGGAIGNLLLALSGGNLFLILLSGMILSMILGMGLPTLAAYVIASSVVGPALTMAGVPMLLAHLFIFYYSLLAMVSPPVALASYTAAGIAKANTSKVGWEGLKLSFAAFVVPFIFVYNPALTLEGPILEILYSVSVTILALLLISYALSGFFFGKIKLIERIILIVMGVLLMFPIKLLNLFSFIFILIFIISKPKTRNALFRKINSVIR